MTKRKTRTVSELLDVQYLMRVLEETLDCLGELPVIDQESREMAERIHREADRLLEYASAGQWVEAILTAFSMGAETKCLANWPPVAKEINRLKRLRRTAAARREKDAAEARRLYHAEKQLAGRHFLRSEAVEEVARRMEVSTKTVNRLLKSKGQL
jgi:hypothetical protein